MMNDQNPDDSCATFEGTKHCGDSGSSDIYLNDDLVIRILSRLPPKSLLRFMCVSKSWRNMISNSLPLSPVSGLIYDTNRLHLSHRRMGYVHLSGSSNNDCWKAIESWGASLQTSDVRHCNGLFLLSNENAVPAAYHVLNPATNQCIALPEPPLDPNVKHAYLSLSALAFDPCKSSHYKVVRLSEHSGKGPVYVTIFSSDECRWINCNVHLGSFSLYGVWIQDLVFMNGVLHLMLRSDSLCSFHVDEVRSWTVKLPGKKETPCFRKLIGKSEGHLFCSAYYGAEMDIWMLQDFETGKWVLKHTIQVENIEKHPVVVVPNLRCRFYLDPLTFHPDLEVLFIEIQGKIISYHFGNKRNDNDRLKQICSEIDRYVDLVVPYSRCHTILDGECNQKST